MSQPVAQSLITMMTEITQINAWPAATRFDIEVNCKQRSFKQTLFIKRYHSRSLSDSLSVCINLSENCQKTSVQFSLWSVKSNKNIFNQSWKFCLQSTENITKVRKLSRFSLFSKEKIDLQAQNAESRWIIHSRIWKFHEFNAPRKNWR